MSLIEVVGAASLILGSLLVFYVLVAFGEKPERMGAPKATRPPRPVEETRRQAA